MVQCGDGVRFPLETIAEALRRDFDGYLAPEPRIARPVDRAHPAGPDGRKDLVGTESLAGGQQHDLFSLTREFAPVSFRCPAGSAQTAARWAIVRIRESLRCERSRQSARPSNRRGSEHDVLSRT